MTLNKKHALSDCAKPGQKAVWNALQYSWAFNFHLSSTFINEAKFELYNIQQNPPK